MAKKQIIKSKKTAPAKKVSKPLSKKNTPAKKVSKPIKKASIAVKKVTMKAFKPAKKQSAPVKKVVLAAKKQKAPAKKVAPVAKKQIAPAKKALPAVKKQVAPVKQVVAPVKAKSAPVKKVNAPVQKEKAIIRTAPVYGANHQNSLPQKAYTGPKKIKYQVEVEIHASPNILYPYLSTSSGLAEWFAKNVDESGGVFTFSWEGSQKKARLVHKRDNESVKFHWIDDPDETFFEIEIVQDDITSDVALVITDFCLPGEKEEESSLWESQIHDLMHVVGS
jgi:uncharacterized protein YndB with AHSA1/START domain